MKKVVEDLKSFCDFCDDHEHQTGETCLGCGKDVCWRCREKDEHGKLYNYSVYFAGSNDGWFCNKCLKDTPAKVQRLLDLYKKLEEIIKEREKFYKESEKKSDAIESVIQKEYRRLSN